MPMPGIKTEEQGNGVGIHNIYMHPSLVWILIGASTFNRKHNPHKTKQKWLLKNQARTTTSKTRASRSSLTRLRTAPVNWRIRNPILLLRRVCFAKHSANDKLLTCCSHRICSSCSQDPARSSKPTQGGRQATRTTRAAASR